MGAETKIEWCDATFNAWVGCVHMSPACEHCYAEASAYVRVLRADGIETWGANAARWI